MHGEGGSRVTSKLKQGTYIHQPTAKVKSAFAAHENLDVINMTYLKTNCFGFASKSAQKLNLKVKFYKIRQRLCRSGGACSLATVFQANTMNEKTQNNRQRNYFLKILLFDVKTKRLHRLKKGVSVSVFVTVTSRKPEYPQTEL